MTACVCAGHAFTSTPAPLECISRARSPRCPRSLNGIMSQETKSLQDSRPAKTLKEKLESITVYPQFWEEEDELDPTIKAEQDREVEEFRQRLEAASKTSNGARRSIDPAHYLKLKEFAVNAERARLDTVDSDTALRVRIAGPSEHLRKTTVAQVFDTYQKARTAFVQSVADLAQNPKNVDALQASGAISLLQPLLLDKVPSIQHNAAQGIGRLANYNAELAQSVVDAGILPHLVLSLSEQNKFYKKAASFVIRSVAKHTEKLARAVVAAGAVEALVASLDDLDPGVKEGAAWALGYIAKHTPELAQTIVDAGAVPLLVLAFKEQELAVKRIAASALADIARHSPELAKAVTDADAIANLVPLLNSKDAKLKRQASSCLGAIAKHNVPLAELVVEGGAFPGLLDKLKDDDLSVRKNSVVLIREIVKHTQELAAVVVGAGGSAAIVDYVSESTGSARFPGIMALGYIAAFNEVMARTIIDAKGIPPLQASLSADHEDAVRSASAWALGHIGRHTSEHAKAAAEANVLQKLLEAHVSQESSDDLKAKAKRALIGIVEKCDVLPALEALLDSPAQILQPVLEQLTKILPNDPKARKAFAANGSLQKIQSLPTPAGSKVKEYIIIVNNSYPEEIVQYYSPSYQKKIIDSL